MKAKEAIWYENIDIPERKRLTENLSVDAAVIGGGMAGVLTAHFLQNAGLRTIVLEGDRIGSGQTGSTTAKITSQHGLIYHRLVKQFGMGYARLYADANQRAIREYRRIVEEQKIECDFHQCASLLYSTEQEESLIREFETIQKLGIDGKIVTETELPFPVEAALRFDGQARFHPLKFLRAIAEPLEIYEHTKVESVKDKEVITKDGIVTADHIIFCCHYPFLNVPGFYFMRMHQERSYVLALKHAVSLENMYLGIDKDGLSFRPYRDLLLLGGGKHRTGENSVGGRYQKLRSAGMQYFPESQEVAGWSAQDCMTLDGVPYIGRYSVFRPEWYVATGFEKWGMTSSMVSAMLISDLILKGESSWGKVFSPWRFRTLDSAKVMLQETGHAAKGLTRRLFVKPHTGIEELENGHGGVVEYEGEKIGAYKDETGEVFLVSIRCRHMGCQLEWNPDERSWDCPCHGSRYDYRGNLIDNPAQKNVADFSKIKND